MGDKNLIDIIREEVMDNMIKRVNNYSLTLDQAKLNLLEIKDVLYSTLMEIEINKVKKKLNK